MAGEWGSYRVRKKRKQSRLYLLIVLFLSIVLFKWGLPVLLTVISKTDGQAVEVKNEGDIIPPQKPVLSALPEATNSAVLKIEGYTESGVKVRYLLNRKEIISEDTNDDGFFETLINLEDGENIIQVVASDQAGNESVSDKSVVVYDHKKVEIFVDSPSDGAEFFGRQNETITVSGHLSESDVRLTINDTIVRLNGDKFNYSWKLAEGENEIKLRVSDEAGNIEEQMLKVSYVR